MKQKIIMIILFLIAFLVLIYIGVFTHHNEDDIKIVLNGSKNITLNWGEIYIEEGFKAKDRHNHNLTKKIKVKNNINYQKPGTYEITYAINNKVLQKRTVKIIDHMNYKAAYDDIDNTTRGWWAKNNNDHLRPIGGADNNELKKYNAYYLGPNKKIIYLTFDEGSLDTYVKEIVDVLDKNNVKATFFLCYRFMMENKNLIKQMVNNGHSIGNHTVNHLSMPSLATRNNFNEYLKEITTFEKGYKEITGQDIEKIYRDPKGEWSFRDLQIIKDLGYKTYFYSAYYLDFNGNVTKEYALNELLKKYHNGAIYLIHSKNKGNYEALNDFIIEMKKLGYKFDLVKNIP